MYILASDRFWETNTDILASYGNKWTILVNSDIKRKTTSASKFLAQPYTRHIHVHVKKWWSKLNVFTVTNTYEMPMVSEHITKK